MNALPLVIENIIYTYRTQLLYQDVLDELKDKIIYRYSPNRYDYSVIELGRRTIMYCLLPETEGEHIDILDSSISSDWRTIEYKYLHID